MRYLNDPQKDTDSFERFRELMQERDDWDPCEFGCEYKELVGHSHNTNKRLFTLEPCSECVDQYMEDSRIAAEEDRAEANYEDRSYYDR